jgi:hypothetical protein
MSQIKELTRQVEDALREVNVKPSTLVFSFAAIAALIISYPSIRSYQIQMDKIRSEVSVAEQKSDKLQRELEFEKSQAAIADERYKSCLPVVGEVIRNGTHYFTSLTEGQKVFDRITGLPLASGTIICDANGTTAVVDNEGRVGALAYTGNRDVIQKRLQRFKGSQYSQPIIKENR